MYGRKRVTFVLRSFAVHLETFAPSDLGPPCFSHDFLLVYQPNYNLHTEIQHGTPLACHKVKAGPLRTVEREALMMKVAGSNRWMEVPAGSLLAAPDPSSPSGLLKLHSYQPTLSTDGTLIAPALRKLRCSGTAQYYASILITSCSNFEGDSPRLSACCARCDIFDRCHGTRQ